MSIYNLNFEEINPDRDITNGAFSNGTHNYRFNVPPTGGGAIIPRLCYFLVEYNFGSAVAKTDDYTATQALDQKDKIAVTNDFMGSMFVDASFRMAGSTINNINSYHAQASILRKRLNFENNFINELSGDITGFDPDFSRRLSKYSKDGLYHRDGLIDCSPYNSNPLSSDSRGPVHLFTQSGLPLQKNAATATFPASTYYVGTSQKINTTQGANGNPSTWYFSGLDGTGSVDYDAAAAVNSIRWTLPDFSGIPGSPAQNALVVNGNEITVGSFLKLALSVANDVFDAVVWRVESTKTDIATGGITLILGVATGALTPAVCNAAAAGTSTNAGANKGGIVSIENNDANLYTQADPRANVVNNSIIWQPPISFFDVPDPNIFFGDMQINLSPNSNWKTAVVESCRSTLYNTDVVHGTDFCFGIKSMRLYLARCNLPASVSPPREIKSFPMMDMLIANKSLPSGSAHLDFTIPSTTKKVVIWIQDSAAGTNTKIPLSRFKARQYTGSGDSIATLQQYGQFAHTFDESMRSMQVTFASITKPRTRFQSGNTQMNDGNPLKNSMLQRWMMTNQNNDDIARENFHDWLSSGPYYCFDYVKASDNTGTYLQVDIDFGAGVTGLSGFPTTGVGPSSPQSNINLFVCAIYEKAVQLQYSEFGTVINASVSMA